MEAHGFCGLDYRHIERRISQWYTTLMLSVLRQRAVVRLGTVLFLLGQLLSIAHALEHGHGAHEHEGQSCIAALLDEGSFSTALIPDTSGSIVVRPECAIPTSIDPKKRVWSRPPSTGPPSI